MVNAVDFNGRPLHFIGVGGIGMSALAYILARRGLAVSGSDLRLTHITQRLQDEGVHIFWSQVASNLEFFQREAAPCRDLVTASGAATSATPVSEKSSGRSRAERSLKSLLPPQVVCSTAIHPENPEYQAAIELGCPILHRSDVLAALMAEYRGIAIAGTHGKTTTSSMIGYMLMQAGLDPTIVVGGEVNAWGGNAWAGTGEWLVAEADESDGSLVKLQTEVGVVTNIELDHPDHYRSLDEVVDTFQVFAQQCQVLIGSIDCVTVRDRLRPTITYSLDPASEADYVADAIHYTGTGTTAQVWERGQLLGTLQLKLLGRHNLSNALAAVAVGRLLQLDFVTIAEALSRFEGARRRFEQRGEYGGILFVDDYAHHPSEVEVTLAAAKLQTIGSGAVRKRVVAIFQPHRYSRTQTFLQEFANAFGSADVVLTTDIYSAGELDPGTITGRQFAEAVARNHPQVVYEPTLATVAERLKHLLQPGDIALFLGAGNLNQLIPELMSFYQTQASETAESLCIQA